MSRFPGTRQANLAGFSACAGLMAFALYAQYKLYLDPCPLCVFQRMAVIAAGILFLIAALHDPGNRSGRIYAVLIGIVTAVGAAVAGRHVWLQHLPADQVPSCGPGFGYIMDSFPLGEALGMIFKGSGECAEIHWQFLGLSMPEWTLTWFIGLGLLGIWNNLRRH
jgi:protein dithiol:quinone oxidoreductase